MLVLESSVASRVVDGALGGRVQWVEAVSAERFVLQAPAIFPQTPAGIAGRALLDKLHLGSGVDGVHRVGDRGLDRALGQGGVGVGGRREEADVDLRRKGGDVVRRERRRRRPGRRGRRRGVLKGHAHPLAVQEVLRGPRGRVVPLGAAIGGGREVSDHVVKEQAVAVHGLPRVGHAPPRRFVVVAMVRLRAVVVVDDAAVESIQHHVPKVRQVPRVARVGVAQIFWEAIAVQARRHAHVEVVRLQYERARAGLARIVDGEARGRLGRVLGAVPERGRHGRRRRAAGRQRWGRRRRRRRGVRRALADPVRVGLAGGLGVARRVVERAGRRRRRRRRRVGRGQALADAGRLGAVRDERGLVLPRVARRVLPEARARLERVVDAVVGLAVVEHARRAVVVVLERPALARRPPLGEARDQLAPALEALAAHHAVRVFPRGVA